MTIPSVLSFERIAEITGIPAAGQGYFLKISTDKSDI